MERRDFLKLCSASGLAVAAGATAGGASVAHAAPAHTLSVFIHLGGGCDVTSWLDPKGAGSLAEQQAGAPKAAMNNYLTSDIPQQGNIRWAPLEAIPALAANQAALANSNFFNQHWQDVCIINGIDMMTNAHDVGTRAIWSGGLEEGKPTVAALIAAALTPNAPMGYISFGGYDFTAGVAPATRLGNLGAIKKLAFPFRADADEADSLYLTEDTQARLAKAREERYNVRSKNQRLPRLKEALDTLYLSRLGQNELKNLVDYLPEQVEQGLAGGAQLAMAAFRAGLCSAVSLSSGGFDTHGGNDQGVANALNRVMPALTRISELAAENGIADRVAVFVGTDFGRTPGYNDGNGKDHWAVSSMLCMGYVNGRKITGNRVVGSTTEQHDPIALDPISMQPGGSVRIGPGHIQNAIRKLMGIEDSEAARLFPTSASSSEFPDLITLD